MTLLNNTVNGDIQAMPMKYWVILISVVLLSGCGSRAQSVDIADVTKAETLTISKKPGQEGIYSISIRGRGKIDGEAEISLLLNGAPYRTERIAGDVAFEWGGDYYADDAEIVYTPINVRSGA